MSIISVTQQIVDEIFEQARAEAPLEACGYLAGTDGQVVLRLPLRNADKSPVHFSFDPKEQFEVVKEIRRRGLKPIAVYHSHPETPARPSKEDIRLALDPDMTWVIASLYGNETTIKSFRITNGSVREERLVIE